MDAGQVNAIRLRQKLPIDIATTDNHDFVDRAGRGNGCIDRIDDLAALRIEACLPGKDNALSPGQRPADGRIGCPAHDHGLTHRDGLEPLEVLGKMPGKTAGHANDIVRRGSDDE